MKNLQKNTQRKMFYVSVAVCLACAVASVFVLNQADFCFAFAEKVLRRPLRNSAVWIEFIKKSAPGFFLVFASIPILFFKFSEQSISPEETEIPAETKNLNLMNYFKKFAEYVLQNKLILFFDLLAAFSIYGISICNTSIGVDTEIYLQNHNVNWFSIGRFGLIFLQKLTMPFGFNLFISKLYSVLFLVLSAMNCTFLFSLFDGRGKKNSAFFFNTIFVSSMIWVNQIYFTLQAAEVMLAIFVCPVLAYTLYSGLKNGKKFNMIFSTLAIAFEISVYQSTLLLVCAQIVSCYILDSEAEQNSVKENLLFVLKLVLIAAASSVLYFAANKILHTFVFKTSSDYLGYQISKSFLNILLSPFFYVIHLQQPNPINFAVAFLLVVSGFSIALNKKQSALKKLSFAVLLLCIFFIPILGGGVAVLRSEFTVPFSTGFFAFYALRFSKGKLFFFSEVIAVLLSFFLLQNSAMMTYTDHLRWEQDKNLCAKIAEKLEQENPENLPVVLCGYYESIYNVDYKVGEVSGTSIFGFGNNGSFINGRGPILMKDLGYKIESTNDENLLKKCIDAEKEMASFPAEGSVKNLGDVVVVKLSEHSEK